MQGLALAAAGVAVGLLAAQLARGLLRAVLFQTRTTDGVAIAVTAGVLLTAAAVACLAPARRAARVAPVEGYEVGSGFRVSGSGSVQGSGFGSSSGC